MPPDEALARLRKVESRVHDCRALTPETSLQNGAIDQLDQRIATRLAALGYAPLAANDAWWDDYRFDPLDFGPNPDKSAQLVVMKQQGERLWMVWLSRGGKLHVTHAPVRGGKQTTFGTAQITSQVNDIAVAEDRIYVATSGDGIVALDRERFSVWNETSRLDANHVSALGYLGGKLYFWLTSESHGAMYRYDPGVDRIDTLFSTKTKAPRGLLDGPPAYHVESILADEQNACLWLGLSSAGSRNGLWRYDLRSGEAQCVGLSGRKVKHIERVGSRLLLGGGPSDTELFLFTPRDSMTCSLLSDAFSAPIFGAGYACAWPAVLLGGDLITSTRKGSGLAVASSSGAFNFQSVAGLYLHRRSGDRPARRKVLSAGSKPAIVHMLAINDHEAVAAESGGIFWRLSRICKGPAASLPWVNHGQGRLADLVARHGRIIEVVAVSSSSQSPGFSPDSASDRDIHSCWAAAPGATTNEWLQFNFDKETTIDSILIVNGWVPDRKSALFYARNHRAARIRVQFAGDDARSYTLHDLNCPQVVHIDGAPRSRNVRVIFEEIYSTGLHNPDDPPWLNISEVLFFEQTGDQATSGGVRESHQNVATLKHQQGEE